MVEELDYYIDYNKTRLVIVAVASKPFLNIFLVYRNTRKKY